MKKIATFIIIFLLGFACTHAQVDQKAKTILDKLSAKTSAYSTIKVNFSLKLENKVDNFEETYQGSVDIKGNNYRLKYMGTEIYYNGKNLWTHILDAEEVQLSKPDENEESFMNPATLLTIYESGFKYQYIDEVTDDGKTCYEIDLIPEKPKNEKYSRIRMHIDKDKMQIHSIKTMGRDGNDYTVTILKMTTNETIKDSHFVFDKTANPKVSVIDLR